MRSEELSSARDRSGALDTSTEASPGAVNTPHGDIRRLVRERRARVPCPLVSKSRGRVERTKKIQKKSKKERHLPETGALDRSAKSTLI